MPQGHAHTLAGLFRKLQHFEPLRVQGAGQTGIRFDIGAIASRRKGEGVCVRCQDRIHPPKAPHPGPTGDPIRAEPPTFRGQVYRPKIEDSTGLGGSATLDNAGLAKTAA